MFSVIISFIIQVVSLGLCLIAGYYSLKIFDIFRSLTSIRLLTVSACLIIWTSLVLIINTWIVFEENFNETVVSTIAEFSITMLFLALAIIAYIQINPIYDRRVRLFGGISFSSFVVLIGFTFSEVIGNHRFLFFEYHNGVWISSPDLFYSLTILVGVLSFATSYYFSSQFLNAFPKSLLDNQLITIDNKKIYSIFIIVFILFFAFIFSPPEISSMIAIILELIVSVHSLMYMYLSYHQPFLQIGYGANPYQLLENNYIGYFVGSSLDTGPSLISKSSSFIEKSGISQMSLEALNVGIITLLGINDSFKEQVAIVPVPKFDEYTSIAVSFFIENPNVADQRVKHRAPSVLGILLPSVMVLSLKGFNSFKTKLSSILDEFNHIDKLNEDDIQKLVATILHQLIY